MVKEVLVPVDGSPSSVSALRVAVAIRDRTGVPLTALIASEEEHLVDLDRTWIDQQCAEAGITDVRVVAVQSHDAVDTILNTAASTPGTVVCLSSHGRSGIGTLALGSVSAQVVRRSPTPVLLVGPHCSPKPSFAVIEVAVDGSPFADRVVDAASEWSEWLHATPWLIRVAEVIPAPVGEDEVTEGGDMARTAHLMKVRTVQPQWDVLHGGNAGDGLDRRARELGAGLIVMGTHGRSGLRRVVLGSVAAHVVHHAASPVLLVGPSVGREHAIAMGAEEGVR